MSKRNITSVETFPEVYCRLEEVMLANSGENEFEEIFKIVLIKLWNDLHIEKKNCTLAEANGLLAAIDDKWPGVLAEKNQYLGGAAVCLLRRYERILIRRGRV